jgi:hypothetical protein
MTLRRKKAYQAAATVAGLLLLVGASLWGLNGLHQDYGFALEGYRAGRSRSSSALAVEQRAPSGRLVHVKAVE